MLTRRRLPLQSVKGQLLQDLFYLGELAQQADIFDRSFVDAMESVEREDVVDVWRHLQAALFAGVVVNRLLRSEGARDKKLAEPRAKRLRAHVGLDGVDSPIMTMHEVRNDLEHFDERLDVRFADQSTHSLADFYLSDGFYLMSGDGPDDPLFAGLRAFNPILGMLHFDHKGLNMFALDLDMLRLKHNARDAQHALKAEVHGRQPFAAVAHQLDAATLTGDYVRSWRVQRQELMTHMCPEPNLAPQIRVWLQLEDQ